MSGWGKNLDRLQAVQTTARVLETVQLPAPHPAQEFVQKISDAIRELHQAGVKPIIVTNTDGEAIGREIAQHAGLDYRLSYYAPRATVLVMADPLI